MATPEKTDTPVRGYQLKLADGQSISIRLSRAVFKILYKIDKSLITGQQSQMPLLRSLIERLFSSLNKIICEQKDKSYLEMLVNQQIIR